MTTQIKKGLRIKKTRNGNPRLFYSSHFFDPIRRFRDIERFWENIFQNAQYLENGDSDQKSFTNKKDAELNFASFLFITFF